MKLVKKSNLKIVQSNAGPAIEAGATLAEEEHREKRNQVTQQWKELEKSWRITPEQVRQGVYLLRRELEQRQRAIEGVPFDFGGVLSPPRSLDNASDRHITYLIEELNPLVGGKFEAINTFCEQHGTHEFLDFQAQLFDLKSQAAETGFRIGVIAGAIFAGSSDKIIDRFERGLIADLQADSTIVKRNESC